MDKIQEFKNIVKEMTETYANKNSDYGDSFGDTYDKLGPISGLVRLYDKLNRATSLVQGKENHFESLEDTFIDMACYAIMNVIELRKTNYNTNNLNSDYIFGNTSIDNDCFEEPCGICSCNISKVNSCGGNN